MFFLLHLTCMRWMNLCLHLNLYFIIHEWWWEIYNPSKEENFTSELMTHNKLITTTHSNPRFRELLLRHVEMTTTVMLMWWFATDWRSSDFCLILKERENNVGQLVKKVWKIKSLSLKWVSNLKWTPCPYYFNILSFISAHFLRLP